MTFLRRHPNGVLWLTATAGRASNEASRKLCTLLGRFANSDVGVYTTMPPTQDSAMYNARDATQAEEEIMQGQEFH